MSVYTEEDDNNLYAPEPSTWSPYTHLWDEEIEIDQEDVALGLAIADNHYPRPRSATGYKDWWSE